MTQQQTIQYLTQHPIIPVFYNNDVHVCIEVATACYKGGVRLFEFTNRGKNAKANFEALLQLKKIYPDYEFGIGTIFTAADAEMFIEMGAKFVVSPCFVEDVFDVCYQNKINYLPGCMTLKEVFDAGNAGCEVVKIFPGEVLGQKFVKSVASVLPKQKMMITGGVEPTKESIDGWFTVGATAVGMGSQLFKKEWLENNNYQAITESLLACGK
jgi:2-dehydro-3-deoxyphosphogluconate aldolase / (4S)-4-hydroxy-2-oxoglutarate aldolase